MEQGRRYVFPPEIRAAYEFLQAPMGVYQLVGKKVVTLLVSDGLCVFQGETRDTLVHHFDQRMFERVHPDDVQMLVSLAYQFAIQKGQYDVVYRSRLYGKEEYRYVHAVSKYHTMENGAQIAFTHYADVTEAVQSLVENAQGVEAPLTRFLNENASAMVIVSQREKMLFYYNKAVCRLLKPAVPFDSNMTFQEFFYPDLPEAMPGLFRAIERGPHLVEEPRTKRQLEVNAISTIWNEEPAYAVYFYEYQAGTQAEHQEAEQRHKRIVFNNMIFTGSSNDLHFWENGSKAFHVWNLTTNQLVMGEGRSLLEELPRQSLTYELFCRYLLRSVSRESDPAALEQLLQRQRLEMLYESGSYPQKLQLSLETVHGQVVIAFDLLLMRSPDDHALYLKLFGENITQRIVIDMLFKKSLEQECDYIAYFDIKADYCRIILGKTVTPAQQDRTVSVQDYLRNFRARWAPQFTDTKAFVEYVHQLCRENGEGSQVYELPNGDIKRIYGQMVDVENQRFFFRQTDVTKLLQTERRKAEEIGQLKDEAQAANREKSLFMARMSHDLRTPMGAILSLARFGLQESQEQQGRKYFQQICDSGEYMLNMLDELLDMQRLEAGQIELMRKPVCLNELGKTVETIIHSRICDKKLELEEQDLLLPDTYVLSDSQRLEQILVNILTNAVKYTPPGGRILWRSQTKSCSDRISVRYEIQDTGVGMTAEFQKKMFQPFSREMNALSRVEGGAGLGLSIVRKLLEAMQGHVAVNSIPGQGTTVRILLDFPRPTAAQLEQFRKERLGNLQSFNLQGKRLLVCEDNEINQFIIQKILDSAGCVTDMAGNGAEGVRFAGKQDYDAILMDIRMPVMGGLEAAQCIRRSNTAVPIIALSANAREEDKQLSLAAGMNAHLMKPIDTYQLFSTLIRLIS